MINYLVMEQQIWMTIVKQLLINDIIIWISVYGTDLTQRHACEWHALESILLSTKISSIHHRVRVDALVKYAQRKHSQQALTKQLISNS